MSGFVWARKGYIHCFEKIEEAAWVYGDSMNLLSFLDHGPGDRGRVIVNARVIGLPMESATEWEASRELQLLNES